VTFPNRLGGIAQGLGDVLGRQVGQVGADLIEKALMVLPGPRLELASFEP
jgi:hypothetical protein